MSHSQLIDKTTFDQIVGRFAENYEKCGGSKPLRFYLVGGAAITLMFDYRSATIDIDAYFDKSNIVKQAIELTAKEQGLRSDWLNDEFIHTPSFSERIIEKSVFYRSYGKYVEVFSLETKYLIAMKLKSSRPTSNDLDDIIKMIYETRANGKELSFADVMDAYNELYPDFSNTFDYFIDETKKAFETPIEDVKLIIHPSIFD